MFSTHPSPACDCLSLAFVRRPYGNLPIQVIDDWGPCTFVYGQEYGPIYVIRAMSWEAAYEIAMDELPPVPECDLFEAYGFDTDKAFRYAVQSDPDRLELDEGFQYQSNSTGSGIVNPGYYEWMHEIEATDDITAIYTPE